MRLAALSTNCTLLHLDLANNELAEWTANVAKVGTYIRWHSSAGTYPSAGTYSSIQYISVEKSLSPPLHALVTTSTTSCMYYMSCTMVAICI
jgi:hypothetical protein